MGRSTPLTLLPEVIVLKRASGTSPRIDGGRESDIFRTCRVLYIRSLVIHTLLLLSRTKYVIDLFYFLGQG